MFTVYFVFYAFLGLLRGVASVISHMPPASTTPAMRELCFMQLNPLCHLMEQDVVPVRSTRTDPVLWLDRLSSILRYVVVNVSEGKLFISVYLLNVFIFKS